MRVLLVQGISPPAYWGYGHSLPPSSASCDAPAPRPRHPRCSPPAHLGAAHRGSAPLAVADEELRPADAVLVSGMLVQASSMHETLARAARLGKVTVVGGPAPTTSPGSFPGRTVRLPGRGGRPARSPGRGAGAPRRVDGAPAATRASRGGAGRYTAEDVLPRLERRLAEIRNEATGAVERGIAAGPERHCAVGSRRPPARPGAGGTNGAGGPDVDLAVTRR